ncbi:MAG TPA: CHAD domain-containing protein [Chloroflexi bacterium]|nr:CHAD domain-containing protein [Chloroflexota bacterium]
MEIEAKFSIPDLETFHRLQALDALAGFDLAASQVEHVHDVYLDTEDRRILAAGYACRRREQGQQVKITLKGLGGAEGAVHRREEWEVSLLADQALVPAGWPDSPVRDWTLQWVGDAPLAPLFDLHQVRHVRLVGQGERMVGELSLDQVRVAVGEEERTYFELEVELDAEGDEGDLAVLVNSLRDDWDLRPEPRSKFERGLALWEGASQPLDGQPAGELLTLDERRACERVAIRDDKYGRQARALLALDEGASQKTAGERAGRSDRTVRYWLAAFRARRLEVFPVSVLEEIPVPTPVSQNDAVEDVEAPLEPWSLDALVETYHIDLVHARVVADHALNLFEQFAPVHGLSTERRALLETAALVHNVGLETDAERHHVVGRDILLSHPLVGLDETENRMVALMVFLHRKRVTGAKLERLAGRSLYADLPASLQQETLVLASLLRIADGLDFSQTGSSRIGPVRHWRSVIEVEVQGPVAALDAARARKKSDLWRLLFEVDVRFVTALALHSPEAEQLAELSTLPLPEGPGLEADDSMAEAARKTLAFHFARMLHHEPGTRLGEDIEALHDMRVATRRMRAALRVFGEYLDLEYMRPLLKGLRQTGRVLGAVRDLDVFWEKTERYLETLAPEQQGGLDPLREAWEAERELAREEMLTYLDSGRYARFKERFSRFLETPGAGALPVTLESGQPLPHRLRHVVPVVIYQSLAVVQAYDEWVTRPNVPLERLHQLRIAAKGLRYTVEYFREVLGPEAKQLVDEIKGLQDHLGDLQDAVVASNLLRDFLTWGTWGAVWDEGEPVSRPTEPIVAPGVAAYLAGRQLELQHLLDTFPRVWDRIYSPEFTRSVGDVLATLRGDWV